ncbi:MAG: hypothetical protein JWM17_275, partial [Actinobacteria bacterium]|nr:hypothetical protein [Actinomycetota bacterium]
MSISLSGLEIPLTIYPDLRAVCLGLTMRLP